MNALPGEGPKRRVECTDALPWLASQSRTVDASVVTSLPDVSELAPMSLADWQRWFVETARMAMRICADEGAAIFFQTDVKKEGVWIDKGYLCAKAAELEGMSLLWHRIVCRAPPGITTFGRPAYAHVLCFSRMLRADSARSTPDVLPETGEMTWARAIGLKACTMACRFVLEQTSTRTVIDPFCGVGTVLAVANALGLNAVGIERNRKRAARAEKLQVMRAQPGTDMWKVVSV